MWIPALALLLLAAITVPHVTPGRAVSPSVPAAADGSGDDAPGPLLTMPPAPVALAVALVVGALVVVATVAAPAVADAGRRRLRAPPRALSI
jgi:hypothetical protein